MFRWIIGTSLIYRYLVLAAAVLLVVSGVDRLRQMPVDVFPEFAPPLVEIQTEGQGMSSVEVEEFITIPMEEALRGTPNLATIRSKSVVGLSAIQMLFERGSDVLLARQRVMERLQLIAPRLSAAAGAPVMLPPLSATSRVMKIGLTSSTLSQLDLSMTAYWKIRFRLLGVPGVANVAMWGEQIKALVVQVDPDKLKAHDVGIEDVREAVSETLDFGLVPYSNSSKTQSVGYFETPNQRFYVQPELPIVTPEAMAQVPIKNRHGRDLRLGDLGKVVWDTPQMIGDAVINDGPGMMLIIEKFPWANTLEVTRSVETALDDLRPGLNGITIDHEIFRPATFIELSIENLTIALLLGALLVILVIGAFLFEWRAALISVAAIPLSLVAAGLILYVNHVTLNTMVLAGFVVALGSVVDDAIIDIENIMRRLRLDRQQGGRRSLAAIILEASLEIRSSIVYATLIIVLAVMPVFFMGGLSGAFFEPLAVSYGLALLASMIVALTVTPALALLLLRNAPLDRTEPLLARWLKVQYDRLLRRLLHQPRALLAGAGVVVLAGLVTWPLLGQSLLPSFKERDLLMHWLTKPGTSHPEMFRITVAASKELRAIPGVRNFGAHIGRALQADEVVGIDFTENWISIDPKADYDKTLAAVQEAVDGYPGLYRDVQTYLKERIREVLTGAGEAVVIRIFGPDLAKLRESAENVKKALEGTQGLVNLHVELVKDVSQIEVTVDLAKAQSSGIKPGDVRRAAALVFAGVEVSDIHKNGKVHDVMVWSIPSARNSIESIRDLSLDAPDGSRVRLGDIAEVVIAATPNVVKREGATRRIDVQANVQGRDLGSVAGEVDARLATVAFQPGYYAELLGEYAERKKAQQGILLASIAAALGIFFLLQACFGSWRLAAMAFLSLPAALVGGILAAYLGDGVISLGSLVGFLTVLGIAARNGILMINHFQYIERAEGMAFGAELVLRGARERLSPILMTTLATGLALVPLVAAGQIPGHEVEHPMAVVILGGLVTSTLLNLLVVPALYLRFAKAESPQPAIALQRA